MTDDGRKKPPRASWEPPEPDAVPGPADEPAMPDLAAPVTPALPAAPEPSYAYDPGAPYEPAPYAPELAPDAGEHVASRYGSEQVPVGYEPTPTRPTVSYDPAASGPVGIPPWSHDPSAAAAPLPAVPPPQSDDPLLPVRFSERDLRDAAGVAPRAAKPEPRKRRAPTDLSSELDDDADDAGTPRRSRKAIVVAVLTGVIGLGIAALVVLGRVNQSNLMIACQPQEVVAEQGRSFPPWGMRALEDAVKWKPIQIPPEAECRERETDDESELSGWYLDMLVERASALLTAREVTKVDEAATILEQALLHARAPERRDQRKEIERLLGDVGYWRASAKLRDAATALADAAKQFDAAALQRPRHVSDASAWATYVRKLADDLRAGPAGAQQSAFPPMPPAPERPTAPAGTALPVEPDQGSAATGSEPVPVAPAGAGTPSGGVLL